MQLAHAVLLPVACSDCGRSRHLRCTAQIQKVTSQRGSAVYDLGFDRKPLLLQHGTPGYKDSMPKKKDIAWTKSCELLSQGVEQTTVQ